ncbi:MAG TPA: prenyltransferase/squalene oxidase repeat-containing protein, partial [Conexibacter sp.]
MRQQNQLLNRARLLAAGVLAAASPAGLAAPAAVRVRVEGLRETLFDRVVLSDGHDVRAASDLAPRRCDGTNGGAHARPGPTATAATADALATRGETFDGTWNAGYEDYFVRRLGSEAEDDAQLRWWGLLVNGASAGAGGCQTRVGDGDELLWANDAFSGRPFLRLAAAGAQPTVPLGAPLAVAVTAGDGSGGAGGPYAGARVEAVDVDGAPAAAGVADAAVSAADGSAQVVFHAAGWQRVKARGPLTGGDPAALPAAIASNSVDVCVEPAPGAGCAGAPPSQVPLEPPAPAPPATDPSAAPPADPPSGPLPAAPARGSTCSVPASGAPHARSHPLSARRLAAGARLRMRCPAGRPVLTLRALSRRATVELRTAGRRARVTLRRRAGARVVRAPRLRRAGVVELRVVRGTVCAAHADPVGGAEDARAPAARPACARPEATGPAGRAAGAPDESRLDLTVRFLQDAQNADGGFGGTRGAPSDPTFSAWVALALAAAGINPRDQARPGGADAYAYLSAHAGVLSATTDFERAALVAVAAGASPRDFGGMDLVAAILARQLPSGAFAAQAGGATGYVNATAFALLPLSALRDPALDVALHRGADWLLSVQEPDGAWGFAPGREPSSDTTAAVLQALRAVGRGGTPQEARAWDYLRALRNPDGGYGFDAAHRESNTASTAWVAQAMWAAGRDPAAAPAGGDPSAL